MARLNKFTSVNFNDYYGKADQSHVGASSGSKSNSASSTRSRISSHSGGMLILTRPKQPPSSTGKLGIPNPVNLPSLKREGSETLAISPPVTGWSIKGDYSDASNPNSSVNPNPYVNTNPYPNYQPYPHYPHDPYAGYGAAEAPPGVTISDTTDQASMVAWNSSSQNYVPPNYNIPQWPSQTSWENCLPPGVSPNSTPNLNLNLNTNPNPINPHVVGAQPNPPFGHDSWTYG